MKKKFGVRLDAELVGRIENLAKASNQPKSAILEAMIRGMIARMELTYLGQKRLECATNGDVKMFFPGDGGEDFCGEFDDEPCPQDC